MSPDPDRLYGLLIQLISISSEEESLEFLQAHSELLTSEAETLINELKLQFVADLQACEMLEIQQHRIEYVRQIICTGEQCTLSEEPKLAPMRQIPPELIERLMQVSSEEELRQLLTEHPELESMGQKPYAPVQQTEISPKLKIILQELSQSPHGLLDMPQRIELCQQALNLLSLLENPPLWATLQNELANCLIQTPNGSRGENIEQAILHYHQSLLVRSKDSFPEEWATTQNNLGFAFANRSHGKQEKNIEQAIHHYQQALLVRTLAEFPEPWAEVQNNLAKAYYLRLQGERVENVGYAIYHYQQALLVYTQSAFSEHWAMIQNNLANVHCSLPRGEYSENLEHAIYHYQQALLVYTKSVFPKHYATIQNNLARVFKDRIQGNHAENIEAAIQHYQQALSLISQATSPEQWAETQNNLAIAYRDRIYGNPLENIEQAIHYYQQALLEFTHKEFPEQWATIQNNLAIAYANRMHESWPGNLERAIHHYRQALLEFTQIANPSDWAMVQNNLGKTYIDRIYGKRAENIEKAIYHYQQALLVYTQTTYPTDWAMTQNNLAAAYRNHIYGNRSENVELAIYHYQQAQLVYTQTAYPADWAMIQNNLGLAYEERIDGKQAENVEKAIYHFEQALLHRTRATFPKQWAGIHNNLATAYRNRILGERAENIELAIYHCQQALLVFTQSTYSQKWAMVQNNLAAAYIYRIHGKQSENIEKAIIHYKQALSLRTRIAFPVDWAESQNNLAAAYLYRIQGKQSENIEKAIYYYQQALLVYTKAEYPEKWAMVENNLAAAYYSRLRGDPAENLEQAIYHYQQALTIYIRKAFPERWSLTQHNLGQAYTNRRHGLRKKNFDLAVYHFNNALFIRSIELLPAAHLQTQTNLGDLLFNNQKWEVAQSAYEGAILAGKYLLETAFTEQGRKSEIRETSQLFTRSAYCLWQLGKLSAAFQQLEQGRTRLLSQSLALGDVNLADLPVEQQTIIQNLRQTIRTLEGEMRLPLDTPAQRSDRVLAEELKQARAALSQQLADIRAEHPDFIPTALDTPAMLQLIPDHGALVVPCITSQGSFVFILPTGATQVTSEHILPLPELTESTLTRWLHGVPDEPNLGGWLGSYERFLRREEGSFHHWQDTIDAMNQQLWQVLMGPIHEQLQAVGIQPGASILLLPPGGLGLLPLHATGPNAHYTFGDMYCVTYASSAYAYSISQRRATQPARQAQSLFAVINPTGDLRYTPIEGERIAPLFPPEVQTMLVETEAVQEACLTHAPHHAYLHFSCHGAYNWQAPMQSGLQLANEETLTLDDILRHLDLTNARLVTLSACETGISEFRESPDEYVGLPAGFLQAGAPAVVSTLWAVNDLSTMLLMERFYQLHLQDGLGFAMALQGAQQYLRQLTAADLRRRFREERALLLEPKMSTFNVSMGYRRFASMDPEELPFEHPYYWAAFTFSGA